MPIHNTACPSCAAEFDVEVEPYIPARDWGHPDLHTPACGGTVEPTHCPVCCQIYEDAIEQSWTQDGDRVVGYKEKVVRHWMPAEV